MFTSQPKTRPQRSEKPIDGSFYDADYYDVKGQSNWVVPYNWANFGVLMKEWWKFLYSGFPETKSFLNVGCGKGLLEQAFLEINHANGFEGIDLEGFDHSAYAISEAHESVKDMVSCKSVDDYEFKRNFDVMLILDVLEHLTPKQAESWLMRSRKHINDCLFAVIALDEPSQWNEVTHINLRDRQWWHEMIMACGWIQDEEHKQMQRLAMQDDFAKANKMRIFIYGSGNV